MNIEISSRFRCKKVIMTNEARVLKELRVNAGLSVRQVAKKLNRSHGIVVQIETGRLDVPKGERLMQLLAIYGVDNYKGFYDRVRNFTEKRSPKEELCELVELMSADRIDLVLKITKRIAAGKALLAF